MDAFYAHRAWRKVRKSFRVGTASSTIFPVKMGNNLKRGMILDPANKADLHHHIPARQNLPFIHPSSKLLMWSMPFTAFSGVNDQHLQI